MEEKREMPEGIHEQVGACRFCGQMKQFHTAECWSEEKLNETATRECNCTDAIFYAKGIAAKEKAEAAAEKLFGNSSDLKNRGIYLEGDPKETIVGLIDIASMGLITGATIKFPYGVTAVLRAKESGGITLKRKILDEDGEEL